MKPDMTETFFSAENTLRERTSPLRKRLLPVTEPFLRSSSVP